MTRDANKVGATGTPIPSYFDSILLAAVQQGDEQAMAALFNRYSKLVYSVALRVLRDPSAAEDVMQEILLQIWRSPSSFIASRGSLGGWLAVVARNRAIDVLRKRRPTEVLDDIQPISPYDLSQDAEKHLLLERVRLLIAKLPLDQRSALEMAFFDGCTHAEIAQQTGNPLGTVKTRIRAALHTLGKAFQQ